MSFQNPFFMVAPALARGGVGVMPTDTIYGIVGSALQRGAVERIYRLRKRHPQKPMIILIATPRDMQKFGIMPDAAARKVLERVWPGKVSVVLPLSVRRRKLIKELKYLHRGTGTLAFRVPASAGLRVLLRRTGPLVAPSANREGQPPARTIRAAKRYFGDRVDFYVDKGKLISKPSTLISITGGKMVVLRKGSAKL